MFFHEIAEELKIYIAPTERGGIFGVQLVGNILRDPMTEEIGGKTSQRRQNEIII